MLSKNRIKLIHSLEQKKARRTVGLFVAEGPKLVGELLASFPCTYLAATAEWFRRNGAETARLRAAGTEVDEITEAELQRASLLRAPQEIVALFVLPSDEAEEPLPPADRLCLALDGVQDPGNLGTIVRLADWFGIEHIFCSPDTADVYNPKAVQATMGALARVRLHYTALSDLLRRTAEAGLPVYGTFLDGQNLYEQPLEQRGVIVMGNEGKGVSREVEQRVTRKLYVPNYPAGRATSESLNVAIATAVVCAEFRRRA